MKHKPTWFMWEGEEKAIKLADKYKLCTNCLRKILRTERNRLWSENKWFNPKINGVKQSPRFRVEERVVNFTNTICKVHLQWSPATDCGSEVHGPVNPFTLIKRMSFQLYYGFRTTTLSIPCCILSIYIIHSVLLVLHKSGSIPLCR